MILSSANPDLTITAGCGFVRKETRFTCNSSLYEEIYERLNTEQLYMLCRICGIISAVNTSDLADQKRE
jgi:hypothetical protein